MTPSRAIRSSRACTVPRATPSRREHSSTPIRGSAANTSRMRASSSSMVMLRTFRRARDRGAVQIVRVIVADVAHIVARMVASLGMTTDAATAAFPALTDAERAAELSPEQLTQLVGLVEYDASRRPVPGHRLGRRGLRGRQRHPDRALLPVGLRHGAGRLLRPRDRQPRPQGVRAQERLVPVRHQGRRRPGQPAARPPPGARRRRLRHRPRGARRRPVHRPRARLRRPGRAGADRRHRRARHRADRVHRGVRRHRALARRPLRATPGPTCPATSSGRRASSSATARRSGCSRPSTTWSATSSSATWTSGSASTTR